jgi:hypothetical protein
MAPSANRKALGLASGLAILLGACVSSAPDSATGAAETSDGHICWDPYFSRSTYDCQAAHFCDHETQFCAPVFADCKACKQMQDQFSHTWRDDSCASGYCDRVSGLCGPMLNAHCIDPRDCQTAQTSLVCRPTLWSAIQNTKESLCQPLGDAGDRCDVGMDAECGPNAPACVDDGQGTGYGFCTGT